MKHYYQFPLYDNLNVPVYFLTNRNAASQVMSVHIPGEEILIPFNEDQYNTYQYYTVKRLNLQIDKNSLPAEIQREGFKFNRIVVNYVDGLQQEYDIGEVEILPNRLEPSILESQSSGSSSENEGFLTYNVKQQVTINRIDWAFGESLKSALSIKINGSPIKKVKFPLALSPGSTLRLDYSFKFQEDGPQRLAFYNVFAKIYVRGPNIKLVDWVPISYNPPLTDQDLDFLKEMEGTD